MGRKVQSGAVGKLSKFTGEQNFEGFAHLITKWVEYQDLADEEKVLALYSHLEGEALEAC
jgi:hypothetical protein